ncbi:MAG: hypothetical protein JWL94_1850 [Microbacteriaceae bacterium]|nr:hypothetical protein [Microbacteriaceae bacterium]
MFARIFSLLREFGVDLAGLEDSYPHMAFRELLPEGFAEAVHAVLGHAVDAGCGERGPARDGGHVDDVRNVADVITGGFHQCGNAAFVR